MTPTDKWILGLVLVYALPSFICGIGITLLFVRWRDIRRATAMTPRFLSPELTFERHDLTARGTAPEDKGKGLLPNGLRPR
jgi:hypothetical protein